MKIRKNQRRLREWIQTNEWLRLSACKNKKRLNQAVFCLSKSNYARLFLLATKPTKPRPANKRPNDAGSGTALVTV